jgi:drug/metabolite transporter (DMT)-like permease
MILTTLRARPDALPILALLGGATFWGLIWYPYRLLNGAGLSGAEATALTYVLGTLVGTLLFMRHWADFRHAPMMLIVLGAAAGISNVCYIIGVTEGEVMRITLLFYIAPVWTVPLAWLILGERLDWRGSATICMALIGAVIMLWRPELGAPLPANRAEWLGLAAGVMFALSNVIVRKLDAVGPICKSQVIWAGVAVIGVVAAVLLNDGVVRNVVNLSPRAWLITLVIVVGLILMSLCLQYGLTHTPATRAAVILLFELVVAGLATYALTGERLRLQDWLGGILIVAAGLIAALYPSAPKTTTG